MVKSVYNGAASTWNAGMQGENLGDMSYEGFRETGKMVERVMDGEATVQDPPAGARLHRVPPIH